MADARQLRELEGENGKLKKLVADAMLDIEALNVVAQGKRQARRCGKRDRDVLRGRTLLLAA